MSVNNFRSLHDPPEPVGHPQLEPEVQRAILASWGSQAFTAGPQPTLRTSRTAPADPGSRSSAKAGSNF